MSIATTFRQVSHECKKAGGRLARRMLPRTGVTLSHVEPGLRMTVDLRRNLMFWWGGLSRFEPYTVDVLRAAIRPGDVAIDVGANIGFFTTLLARLVGPEGRVLAFEPDQANLAMLRANLDQNRLQETVTVVASAVASEPGNAMFSLDSATGSTGHLGETPTLGGIAFGGGALQLVETPVNTIDEIVERLELAPVLIKMDIEGGEFEALRGAARTIDVHRPLVLSELGGTEGSNVVQFLNDRDYRLWDLETGEAVGSGVHPAMVVGVHAGMIESDRGRRVLDALEALRQSR